MNSVSTPASASASFWSDRLYIKSAGYDWFWIILSPLWAIAFGYVLSAGLFQQTVTAFDATHTAAFFFYMSITQAHLMITVFRTHLNKEVYESYYWRFTLVPMAVWFCAITSNWMFAFLFVLMTFWDVYHSSMQVFGIGRIYDRLAGNDPKEGRFEDALICILMYTGPILSGSLLVEHLGAFGSFHDIDAVDLFGATILPAMFTGIPGTVVAAQPVLRTILFVVVGLVSLLYAVNLWKLRKEGYHPPLTKLIFFVGTAITCIFAWGYNSFGMGYLIANLFHAVQYFALVWVMEQRSVQRVFGKGQSFHQSSFRLGVYLLFPLTLGFLSLCFDSILARAALMTCALMHFWWDGFVWSVRSDSGINSKSAISG